MIETNDSDLHTVATKLSMMSLADLRFDLLYLFTPSVPLFTFFQPILSLILFFILNPIFDLFLSVSVAQFLNTSENFS